MKSFSRRFKDFSRRCNHTTICIATDNRELPTDKPTTGHPA